MNNSLHNWKQCRMNIYYICLCKEKDFIINNYLEQNFKVIPIFQCEILCLLHNLQATYNSLIQQQF